MTADGDGVLFGVTEVFWNEVMVMITQVKIILSFI